MVVQSNIPALNSHRNLLINNSNLARNLERLSSGFRINRAGDDAAGLSISERMRTQIRGLGMAEMNTQNGIQLIQTAEGGLNETHAILQRMRELAVMSSNATFQASDREQIHLEVVALVDEIDRISSSTHYNRINLLDGTFGSVRGITDENSLGLGGDIGLTVAIENTAETSAELLNVVDLNARIIVTPLYDMDGNSRNFMALQVGDRTFRADELGTAGAAAGTDFIFRNEFGQEVARLTNSAAATVGAVTTGVISGIRFHGTAAGLPAIGQIGTAGFVAAAAAERGHINSVLSFQIGANGGLDQRAALQVFNMSSVALGMTDINGDSWSIRDLGNWTQIGTTGAVTESEPGVSILTQRGANAAIEVIDAAIDQVSRQRASLGAMQNRMESTLNSLGVARENLTAAESTIRDVDMAREMMSFTQNNILTQAAQAMLAQANQLPQGVLQLLR